ncbi:hypothetical protein [Desulfosporosinus youngiae]|uniref:Uncharacterized protein n=1 Tax=Desulfosporosinus youngiae DSM 17734 TaxID=768710 RepID=H5XT17_9FIRM|nr:hypothetical protein [Desulfosporosinus youngiae]EHQ88124.1 hypothetical protein DesyoDRAFT_0952 [Desulfosporosinus youngiae DSM 17734]
MLPTKRWRDFFLYLGRVFVLLILLAFLLPKLVAMCNSWMSTLLHNDQKPHGNPLRVETTTQPRQMAEQ